MQDKKLLIADGHHRYRTAVKYKDKYGYVMATMVNSDNEGMVILPSNRILDQKIDINDFKKFFNIKEAKDLVFGDKLFIVATKDKKYLTDLKKSGTEKIVRVDQDLGHLLITKHSNNNILEPSSSCSAPPNLLVDPQPVTAQQGIEVYPYPDAPGRRLNVWNFTSNEGSFSNEGQKTSADFIYGQPDGDFYTLGNVTVKDNLAGLVSVSGHLTYIDPTHLGDIYLWNRGYYCIEGVFNNAEDLDPLNIR